MKLIKYSGERKTKNSRNSRALFLCPYCENEVERYANNGKRDSSCGCMRNTLCGRPKTHGDSRKKSPHFLLYRCWKHMNSRCYIPSDKRFERYGGRGIKACERWRHDYPNFKKDMLAIGWKPGLTIDRIDNDGNYEPANCRFVTAAENCRNSSNAKLTWKAVRIVRWLHRKGLFTQKELGEKYGVDRRHIGQIVRNKVWKE